ncbi:hypothetical protein V2J09_000569 [Rumex salicifolius]
MSGGYQTLMIVAPNMDLLYIMVETLSVGLLGKHSSTEAEYRAIAFVTTALLWIQELLKEMRAPFTGPPNLSATFLYVNPVQATLRLIIILSWSKSKLANSWFVMFDLSIKWRTFHEGRRDNSIPISMSLSPCSDPHLRLQGDINMNQLNHGIRL